MRFASEHAFSGRVRQLLRGWLFLAVLLCVWWAGALAQSAKPTKQSTPGTAPPEKTEIAKDPLGRSTPRGTLYGFLTAARKGDNDSAAQYLNTHGSARASAALAAKLFIVLDRRLPARLNEVSDNPEGNSADALNPNQDSIGRISDTDIDIVLERVERKNVGRIWLFSASTLKLVPDLYDETNVASIEDVLPSWLVNKRIADITLYEYAAVFIGLPSLYMAISLVNWLLSLLVGPVRRRASRNPGLPNPVVLPHPVRLFIVAAVIRVLLSKIALPLLARQFWKSTSVVIASIACVWLLILLNSLSERYIRNYLQRRNLSGVVSVQRLVRRMIDLAILLVGTLIILRHFGVDISTALAGLGVGGIAVALAAQKTLENVVAGVSLILDKAVRVGDTLNLGNVEGTVGNIVGTVIDVGLRSIRIRTKDRTIVNIPNGQLANMSVEVLSARDKFCFNPTISLRHETTSAQISSAIEGFRNLLETHARVERDSVRVRFLRMASFSFDVEVFAYIYANHWNHFLEIQEELLHGILHIVQQNGAQLALPSQTMYLATQTSVDLMSKPPTSTREPARVETAATFP